MTSNAEVLPGSLVRHVERSRSLHETVIVLTVLTIGHPTVSEPERYTVEKLTDGFYRIVMRFGFMEEPKVVSVLQKAVKDSKIPFPPDEVTYYLGRENFIASAKGHMGVVTESLFAFLQKNAVAADRFFGLPPRQVVELGTQMDL